MEFSELLQLDVPCDVISTRSAAVLVVGQMRKRVHLAQRDRANDVVASVFFGMQVHTSPMPVLVHSLITERGARLDKMSLFAWLEENFMEQPRADVAGLYPTGEQPFLFVRDLDLDRPVEAYVRSRNDWQRIVGVVLADGNPSNSDRVVLGDEAALTALNLILPDATEFVQALRADVARGVPLRSALRAVRKSTSPALMHVCDGWRVLARAARCVVLGQTEDRDGSDEVWRRLGGQ